MQDQNKRDELAQAIWKQGVAAVDPKAVTKAWTQNFWNNTVFQTKNPKIFVLGGGKAGCAMASGFVDSLPVNHPEINGWINVPEGQLPKMDIVHLHPARPAGINLPTQLAVEGSQKMLELAETAREGDILICLVSGGGSALMPLPADGISLEDKQKVTSLLSANGADITELNCVRKHLSKIKGGRLAEAFFHATHGKGELISLILSDVIGDPLDVIASGVTVADSTTFADAWFALEKHKLLDKAPRVILEHFQKGMRGEIADTPKQLSGKVQNIVLGNNQIAASASLNKALELGYKVLNLGSFLDGDTAECARFHAGVVKSILRDHQPMDMPVCIISGGETTVQLGDHHGKGGRNQEFALAFLEAMKGFSLKNVTLLAGGTDGEDGPTTAAGALVNQSVCDAAKKLSLDSSAYLARHDAFHYFEKTGGLFSPGPTGTNVMDLRVILMDPLVAK